MLKDQLLSEIEARKDELFQLLQKLVSFDSQSFGFCGREEECARFIADYLTGLGLETELYTPLDIPGFTEHPDYFPGHGLENRYNVTARYRGKTDEDALMIMGHIDTVPVGDESVWTVAPFSGEIKDGKLYGRGAGDDKFALAAAMFMLKLMKEAGYTPQKNLLFTAYCDEEFGGSHGALASCIKYPCERIVNLDGDEGQLWFAATGGGEVTYSFHTSSPADTAAPTQRAIPVIMEETEAFKARRKAELELNPYYAGTVIPDTALRYLRIWAGLSTVEMDRGFVHFVFYTDKTRDEIEAELNEMHESLKPRLAKIGIVGDGFTHDTRFFHYVAAEPDCAAITDMVEASKEAAGWDISVCGSCLSDLSVIIKYGSKNAFGFGIGRDFGLPGGAHQKDEYIECAQLVKLTRTITVYAIKSAGD